MLIAGSKPLYVNLSNAKDEPGTERVQKQIPGA
jgi:hypothetical protein